MILRQTGMTVATCLLAACGGGGGGGGSSSTPNPPPAAPTVTLSFASNKTQVGVADTLTWSTTGAASCTGTSGLTGSQATSGSAQITPTAGGVFQYTLNCTGAGGTTAESTTLVVPLPVNKTSYLNEKTVTLPPAVLPIINDGTLATGGAQFSARAYADFEQSGSYSLFEMTIDYDAQQPAVMGSIYFWHINSDGTYTDITAKILGKSGLHAGCLHARKAVVADFNQDGKPDIFVACHGYDGNPPGTPVGPPPGEIPVLLLSQPDGTYKISFLPLSGPAYMHSATAADINGDGYPDIVVVDDRAALRNLPTVYSLINNTDGTFTEDHTQFQNTLNLAVWSTEMIDFNGDGNLELWISGQDADLNNGGLQSSVYSMTGKGTFNSNPMITFPPNQTYQTPLDVTIANGYAYFNRTDAAYDGYTIEKINLSTCSSSTCAAGTVLYTNTADFSQLAATNSACVGYGGKWIDFFRILNNKIITDDSCRSPNVNE